MPFVPRTALAALVALAPVSALPASFVVTRLDDPSADGCRPADCSLREAVLAANTAAGADSIQLPAGTLTFSGDEIAVTGNVSITGAGAAATTLYNTLPTLFAADGTTLVLADLAIDGPPLARAAPVDPARLASIQGSLPLAITGRDGSGVTLRRVHALVAGGMVQLSGSAPSELDVAAANVDVLFVSGGGGHVSIVDSTMSLLAASGGGDIDVLVRGTRVRGDTVPPIGGGIALETGGEVRIVDTEFDGAMQGILVQGPRPAVLDLLRIDLHGDSGPLYVLTQAPLTVTDSTFHDNTATGDNPAAMHLSNGASATIRGSTFRNNRGGADTGGAILIEATAHALIVNSTFSSNGFTAAAGNAGARGGAIGVRGWSGTPTSLLLNHVTIVSPTIVPAGTQGTAIGIRGASGEYSVNVHNSILRGSCKFDVGGGFDISVGDVESPGHTCGLDDSMNLVDVDAADLAIGSFGDHGGRTATYLPAANSVAVGNAEMSICLGDDQRGYLRSPANGCDSGAVEVDGIDRLFADGFDG